VKKASNKSAKSQLLELTRKIVDAKDREVSQAITILISALEVGPDPNCIVRETGYPLHFVDAIVNRMRHVGLWSDGLVDDREWWDSKGDLRGVALFAHALVALGQARREKTSTGATYLDAQSGEVIGVWRNPALVQ